MRGSNPPIALFTDRSFDVINVTSHRPIASRVDVRSIYIINVRLADLPGEGSPAHAMYLSLLPYFVGPDRQNLHYYDAPYEIDVDNYTTEFKDRLHDALQNLDWCVCITLGTRLSSLYP